MKPIWRSYYTWPWTRIMFWVFFIPIAAVALAWFSAVIVFIVRSF